MSTLPVWNVHVPGQPDEAEAILRSAAAGTGLDYIRLSTSVSPRAIPWSGDLTPVRRGSRRAVAAFAVGPSLRPILGATADLDATVLYASTIPRRGRGPRTGSRDY